MLKRFCLAALVAVSLPLSAFAQSPVSGGPAAGAAPSAPTNPGVVPPVAPPASGGPVVTGPAPAAPAAPSPIAPAAPPAVAPALPPAPAPAAMPAQLAAGEFWIQVASRELVGEAIALAQSFAGDFPRATVFQSQNGWNAIVVDTVHDGAVQDTLQRLKDAGRIPQDSYATKGKSFVRIVWPQR